MRPIENGARTGARSMWMHAALLGALFAALLVRTWGIWPDVLIDFGRELYVPWQLTEGRALFSDLAWFNGPLSPTWNWLMFELLGVGFTTLVGVNAVLFAVLIALLHYILREVSTPSSATCACAAVMVVCGFGQLTDVGNYNFIAPYSHEVTHGLALGIAALAAMLRGRGNSRWNLAAGFLVGLAFLTKPEMFVAALTGAGSALVLYAMCHGQRPIWPTAAFAMGLIAPILVSVALMTGSQPLPSALRSTLGAWPELWSTDVSSSPFYRVGMGLDDPGSRAASMLYWATGGVALLIPSALIARRAGPSLLANAAAFGTTGLAFGALLLVWGVPMLAAARALPLIALAAVLATVWRFVRERSAEAVGPAAFAAFALVALAKLGLHARVIHYGFALALPATALTVIVLLDWLPRSLASRRFNSSALRAGGSAIVIGFALVCWAYTDLSDTLKTERVGSGRDLFRADARGRAVNEALQWLESRFPPGRRQPTLVVMPEGVMINYLARLQNPTPFINFVPVDLTLFGEGNVEAALRLNAPDVILLIHRDTSEYGPEFFGRDYAHGLAAWVEENYVPARVFGDPPFREGSDFGIKALVRRGIRSGRGAP